MEKCLQCDKVLQHVPGRRQKSFCDVNCRNKYFYAKRKEVVESAQKLLVQLPSDYVEVKNIAILTKEGEIEPIFPKPHKKPQNKPVKKLTESIDYKTKSPDKSYDAPKSDIVFKSVKEYDRLIPITNKTDDLKVLLSEILTSPLLDKDKKLFESRINLKINWNERLTKEL